MRRFASSVVKRPVLTPLKQYEAFVQNGYIKDDPHQREILKQLGSTHSVLETYRPKPLKPKTQVSKLTSWFLGTRKQIGPSGVYLYGDVGSGKTMMMDLFYSTVPAHLKKKRVHFHAFMQEIHKRVHVLRSVLNKDEDPIHHITDDIAAQCNVLALDEMQVTDIADAMILRHLLEQLYADGVVTFFTSNREPSELYKHGVQRNSFIPAIKLLEQRNHVIKLDSPTDYRKLPRPASGVYYFPDPNLPAEEQEERARNHCQRWFDYFADGVPPVYNRQLKVWGRSITLPKSADDHVMQFTFEELCGDMKSAADYLEMCRQIDACVISDIPELSLEQRDIARRFITFLDAAYDAHIKLAAVAAKPFNKLFNTKHLTIDAKTHKVVLIGDDTDNITNLSNFAGHEEMFAFARALSRLEQMASIEWLEWEAPTNPFALSNRPRGSRE